MKLDNISVGNINAESGESKKKMKDDEVIDMERSSSGQWKAPDEQITKNEKKRMVNEAVNDAKKRRKEFKKSTGRDSSAIDDGAHTHRSGISAKSEEANVPSPEDGMIGPVLSETKERSSVDEEMRQAAINIISRRGENSGLKGAAEKLNVEEEIKAAAAEILKRRKKESLSSEPTERDDSVTDMEQNSSGDWVVPDQKEELKKDELSDDQKEKLKNVDLGGNQKENKKTRFAIMDDKPHRGHGKNETEKESKADPAIEALKKERDELRKQFSDLEKKLGIGGGDKPEEKVDKDKNKNELSERERKIEQLEGETAVAFNTLKAAQQACLKEERETGFFKKIIGDVEKRDMAREKLREAELAYHGAEGRLGNEIIADYNEKNPEAGAGNEYLFRHPRGAGEQGNQLSFMDVCNQRVEDLARDKRDDTLTPKEKTLFGKALVKYNELPKAAKLAIGFGTAFGIAALSGGLAAGGVIATAGVALNRTVVGQLLVVSGVAGGAGTLASKGVEGIQESRMKDWEGHNKAVEGHERGSLNKGEMSVEEYLQNRGAVAREREDKFKGHIKSQEWTAIGVGALVGGAGMAYALDTFPFGGSPEDVAEQTTEQQTFNKGTQSPIQEDVSPPPSKSFVEPIASLNVDPTVTGIHLDPGEGVLKALSDEGLSGDAWWEFRDNMAQEIADNRGISKEAAEKFVDWESKRLPVGMEGKVVGGDLQLGHDFDSDSAFEKFSASNTPESPAPGVMTHDVAYQPVGADGVEELTGADNDVNDVMPSEGHIHESAITEEVLPAAEVVDALSEQLQQVFEANGMSPELGEQVLKELTVEDILKLPEGANIHDYGPGNAVMEARSVEIPRAALERAGLDTGFLDGIDEKELNVLNKLREMVASNGENLNNLSQSQLNSSVGDYLNLKNSWQ